jgi:hypothetical protein
VTDEEVMKAAADQLAKDMAALFEEAVAAPLQRDDSFRVAYDPEMSWYLRWYRILPPPPPPDNLVIVTGV